MSSLLFPVYNSGQKRGRPESTRGIVLENVKRCGRTVIKKVNAGETSSLIRTFVEGIPNEIQCDCQWYTSKSTERKYLMPGKSQKLIADRRFPIFLFF